MPSKEGQPPHKKIQQRLDGICESDDPSKLYAYEIGKIPRLTPLEENDILEQLKTKKDAENRLSVKDNTLSEQDKNIARQQIVDGEEASEWFIKANQSLVISVAKHYLNRGVPFMDLIQEGNIGFMKGIEKYDFRPDTKLTTYATYWIRQTMGRVVENQGETIRLPVYVLDKIRKYSSTKAILVQEFGRKPHDEEIAERLLEEFIEDLVKKQEPPPTKEEMPELLEKKIKDVRWVHQVMNSQPLDLDASAFSKDDDVTFGELLAVPEPEPEETVGHHSSVASVQALLSTLSPREERVLLLRHGFVDGKIYTLDEIGKEMGVTRERVRQIEQKALKRLRTQKNQKIVLAEEKPILSVEKRDEGNKMKKKTVVDLPDEIKVTIMRDANCMMPAKYSGVAGLYLGSSEQAPMSFDAIAEYMGMSSRNVALNFRKFLQSTYGTSSILQLQNYVAEHHVLPLRLW